jgi:DNA-binding CsgD family transcriptional regulator
MTHAEAFILPSQLAKEGPRSAAGDEKPRRAHKRSSRPAGPKPADRRRAEASVSERKRVGVVHEHDVLRHGIAGCLRGDDSLSVVFAVREGPVPEPVDVAVVSSHALASTSFDCPLVLFQETASSTTSTRAGASVYATLSLPRLTAEQLVASVRAAAAGLQVSELSTAPAPSRLDERRLEVLRLLAAGETTKTISAKLSYSERTIKTLIRDVEYELSARSRAQAVAEAIRQGLI